MKHTYLNSISPGGRIALHSLLPCIMILQSTGGYATEELALSEQLYFDEGMPIVLSATRLSQPLPETPAAITVINREMIEASGAIELVDLLRLVPGFQVGYYLGSKFTVTSHGRSDRFARDMQVLIDGRSIYDPTFGGITWSDQQLDIDDINRIEVIRGPNAAAYGSNSFAGIINIITEHPAKQQGTTLKLIAGQGATRQVNGRHAGRVGNMDYRLSLQYDENSGFELRNDDSDTRWISFRGDQQLNQSDALLLEFGYSSGLREDGFLDPAGFPDAQGRLNDPQQPLRDSNNVNHFQHMRWTRSLSPDEEYSLQFYHNYQKVDDDFLTQVPGLTGLTYQLGYGFESHRYDLEFQRNTRLSPDLRLVWGLGARYDVGKGPRVFSRNDSIGRSQHRAFFSSEWRPMEYLTLNAGGMFEKFENKKGLFSPRLALNLRADKNNSFRLVVTEAYRMPTIWEDNANQQALEVDGLGPFPSIPLFLTNENLEPEKIRSFEAGYLGHYPDKGLTLDIKVFEEQITDMIDEVFGINPVLPGENITHYINDGKFTVAGFEVELQWKPSDKSLFHLGYSRAHDYGSQLKKVYPVTDNTQFRVFNGFVPQQTFSLLGSYYLGGGYQISSAYYYMDEIVWAGDGDNVILAKRWDIKLAKRFKLNRADGDLALIFQNINSNHVDFYDRPGDGNVNRWEDRVFLQARMNWY